MGVLGLWQLLAPVGQPVALESLENKIFAIDISIWLNQALKGYRDAQGGSVANAHLLSLFSRLCKLLYYKIRPIIVFDGGYPELKKQTIINRQQRRAAVKQTSKDIGLKILSNYLASQNLVNPDSNAIKTAVRHKEKVRDEIFMLPPLPDHSGIKEDPSDFIDAVEWKFTNFSKHDIKYLNEIDIESDDFNKLPPDVKQEILSTLKESRKHRSWDQELPNDSNEFSSYQMQCLLKKRNLQRKLEEVQKDMRQISSADFVSQYTNDHVIGETNKIMSDDYSHYVLLKKMKKDDNIETKNYGSEISSSAMIDTKNIFIKDMENIDVDVIRESNVKPFEESSNNSSFEQKLEEESIDNPPPVLANSNLIDIGNYSLNLSSDDEDDDIALAIEMSFQEHNAIPSTLNGYVPGNNSIIKTTENSNKISVGISETKVSPKHETTFSAINEKMISCNELITNASYENTTIKENNILSLPQNNTKTNFDTSISHQHGIVLSSIDKITTCNESITNALPENIRVEVNDLVSSSQNNTGSITGSPINAQNVLQSFENANVLELDNRELTSNIPENSKSVENSNILDITVSESSTSTSQEREIFDPSIPSTSSDFLSPEQRSKLIKKSSLELQHELATATLLLEADQAKQDRQSRTVQEHMVEECKELLQLFGVPFVVSPTEAEAQCAFYDVMNLTHGTITDDSDVWLFGGKRVYKNFFTQQKYVEFYKDNEIFAHFGLSRHKLISFAMLTGSDYTEGIDGVGPVTAMEILSEFPGEDIEGLCEFKTWWTRAQQHAFPPENKTRAKLLKLVLGEQFPDERIVDAYLNPDVDDSTEKFTWGRPDLDALRDYTKEHFGWSKGKADEALLPVIKRLSERSAQTHLDSFFTVSLKKQTELFPSKRIMSALKKLTSPRKEACEEETKVKTPTKRKVKNSKRTANKNIARKSVRKMCKASKVTHGPILSEESSDEA